MDQRSTVTKNAFFVGRKNLELPLFFDRCFDKNRIKTFIGWLLANFGENATVYIVEKLKNLGFYFATEAGISLSIDDLQVPSNKNWLLSQAEKDIKRNDNNFQCGNLTPVEQSQQLLDRWHRTSETLRESVIQSFRLTNTLNPVYMMAFSGARGNISQVRQLVGMRGLMADPQGQIISFPIRSNFREGLTLTEYVISCYGARKGVVDTALRTADSGYLTRRLVDVSQHVIVWTFDCKTNAGINLTEMKEGKKIILSLKKRILGRILAQEIPTIAFRNQQISAQLAQQIVSLKEHVLVRSPLSCSVPNSVCQLCYGWSLSRGRIVSLGEAVGVIAAQSIGEPGTQLTMRTFHTGGVFSGDVIDEIRAPHDGVVRFLQPLLGQLIRTSHGKIAYLTRASGSFVIENNSDVFKYLGSKSEQKSMVALLPAFAGTAKAEKSIFATQLREAPLESQTSQEPLYALHRDSLYASHRDPLYAKHRDFLSGAGAVLCFLLAKNKASKMQRGSLEKVLNSQEAIKSAPIFGTSNLSHTLITLEPGTALFVRQGEKVIAKQLLAEYSSISAQTKERVEAQHQVYSDQKGEIFFDDVVLGKELKEEEPETENIVTSLKLNTLWILSGTFFEPPVSSTLYTKIGDLIDKTTLLTLIQSELNLQTSHSDGEYILSAQLKKKKTTKRKEKLVTFFRKSLPSSQLPKISQNEASFFQKGNLEDHMKKKESLFLNQFSLNLTITNITYKKSGYFFTDCKKEKPYNLYSFFLQAGSANLINNFNNLKSYRENNKALNWNLGFGKVETNFLSFPKSYIVTKQKPLPLVGALGKEIKNLFVLAEPKERAAFFFKNPSMQSIETASMLCIETASMQSIETASMQSIETVFSKNVINLQNKSNYKQASQEPLYAKHRDFLYAKHRDFLYAKHRDFLYAKHRDFLYAKHRDSLYALHRDFLSGVGAVLCFLQAKNKTSKMQNDSRILILEYLNESAKAKDLWWRSHNFSLKPSMLRIETSSIRDPLPIVLQKSIFAQPPWFRKGTDSVTLDKKGKILRKIEDKKNINHFFTTTSLNQPFSNCREFKNEFLLQSFSPFFKTKGGGLIYTNNYYCNKRSIEAHIFFIAEENYGKKDFGKMNFGTRKKSFNIVSFKELIAPSVCLTNVSLDGQKKPSFSSRDSFLRSSGNLVNSLSNINIDEVSMRSIEDSFSEIKTRAKPNKKPNNFIERNVFSIKTDFGKKKPEENLIRDNRTVSINSFLSEMSFLQNQNSWPTPFSCETKKELFFLRKKPRFYSALFHSTKTTPDKGETFNTTINLLKKGFFSFKNKWVETDIPLGYQKNLQGNQIPFYSRENGVLKNNFFFINQYSNFWGSKKSQRFSGSFLENFLPLTSKHPSPHIKIKNENFSSRNTFFIDSLYLNKNYNEILIKNFNKKPLSEKVYQKEFWLGNLQKKGINSELTLSFNPPPIGGVCKNAFLQHLRAKPSFLQSQNTKTLSFKEKYPFLYSKEKMKKEKMKFSLLFLLTKSYLSLAKKKPLKFNPFPSKGNYSSSAFIFRINVKAIRGSHLPPIGSLYALQFQRQSSVFYNSYPYSQPIFVKFLQNKSTANFNSSSKNLKTNLGLQDKHVVLQNQNLFSKRSSLVLQKQKQEINLKERGEVKDSKFPQNFVLHNHSKNTKDKEKKLNKFSFFLQKQIEKSPTKKHGGKATIVAKMHFCNDASERRLSPIGGRRSHHKTTGENLQRSNLQIRSGWLYLPKDQFQTAKAHQSFIPPFQQKIDEILFDQFPVYVESILRKNFEEELTDKYLQPSTNIVDFCKTKTLIEKSQLQKFINQISNSSKALAKIHFCTASTPDRGSCEAKQLSYKKSRAVQDIKFAARFLTFCKQNVRDRENCLQDPLYASHRDSLSGVGAAVFSRSENKGSANHSTPSVSIFKERSNKFLLSLRETFWRGSTFSSFVENDFTTFHGGQHGGKHGGEHFAEQNATTPLSGVDPTTPLSGVDSNITIAEGDAEHFPKENVRKNAFLHCRAQHQKQDNNEDIFKLSERGLFYQTNLPTNSSNHTTISSTSSFLSFLLRDKKERKTKYLQEKKVFSGGKGYPFASQEPHFPLENVRLYASHRDCLSGVGYGSTNDSPSGGSAERHVFLRPVSINPIKIVFQVVTNKSCRFHSIQSFVLSCVNNSNFTFSQDFFLQSQIIERKLIANATSQNETCTENKVNPSVYNTISGSPKLFLCLPQISRIYFIKNKPFSDFVLVSRQLNLNQVKIRSNISSDILPSVGAWKSENGISKFFLRENPIFIGGSAALTFCLQNVRSGKMHFCNDGETFKETLNIGEKQNQAKSAILSEKNKSLIYRAKQILVPTKKKLVRYKNLSQILQNKTFLIQNFSTEVDTDYFSFLVSIPTFLKSEKGVAKMHFCNTFIRGSTTNTLFATPDRGRNSNLRKETSQAFAEQKPDFPKENRFQKKKLSFSEFFSEKSKLWLLIRKSAEYPLLDPSISQQKTRLRRGNQTFFEKELIYSSTPLSLYMSNKMTFSSKFNKQKKKEIDMSFYNFPKVGLKIKENIFYLLSAFSKLERQHFANLSVDLIKKKFFEEKSRLPQNFFSCQNIFWQIFDLHCQNVQKNKIFEGKQPLFVKKTFALQEGDSFSEIKTRAQHQLPPIGDFASKMQEEFLAKPIGGNKKHDTEAKDLLKNNLSFQGGELLENRQKQSRTWFFQKENLENFFFPKEKEHTIIRFFKQSYLLHFFLNFNISKQSPLQRIEIHTTFEKIEGSTQTSSCAHRLNLQEVQKKAKNEFFINRHNVRIKNLNLQSQKTSYLQKNDGQPQFFSFTGLNLNEVSMRSREEVSMRSREEVSMRSIEEVSMQSIEEVSMQSIEEVSMQSIEEVSMQSIEEVSMQSIEEVSMQSIEEVSMQSIEGSQERDSSFDVDIFKKKETKNKASQEPFYAKHRDFLSGVGAVQKCIFASGSLEQNRIFPVETPGIILEKNLNDHFYDKIKTNLLPQSSLFTKQLFLRNVEASQENSLTSDRSFSQEKRKKHGFNKMNFRLSQKKLKFWKYSFTPFARDLAFTLSFTAKLNQSWFFSLANKVENKIGTFLFEENQPLQDLEFSTFQNQKFIPDRRQLPQTLKEAFIFASKTQLHENKRKQGYFKNKKLISKESSFYPLKERNSYTTLLLDQTITTYDKTPVAITAIMSREEGEIENLKGNSACLILKNSDIEILLTKKEKPLVVVGQLIRYGEEIANGIAAPKSGQIIQVDTNKVTLRKAQPILFPRGGSVDVSHGDYVKEGSPLLSLSYQRLVTGDIVQGIPKIEQLFEARETEGGQPLLSSLHSELEAIFLSYSTQLSLKLAVRESFKEIQQIIVDRVQRVYIAQGVLIADKHFEVVIRQMTSKVRILDGGKPGFLYGELVDLRRVEIRNGGVPFTNELALYEPIILGISKACLEAEGFLSPASFQETTRVLSLAAIERKTDFLRGIKERVILGDVIPVGTGCTLYERPVKRIKKERFIDLSLSVLHNARSILSTNHYYKQL